MNLHIHTNSSTHGPVVRLHPPERQRWSFADIKAYNHVIISNHKLPSRLVNISGGTVTRDIGKEKKRNLGHRFRRKAVTVVLIIIIIVFGFASCQYRFAKKPECWSAANQNPAVASSDSQRFTQLGEKPSQQIT